MKAVFTLPPAFKHAKFRFAVVPAKVKSPPIKMRPSGSTSSSSMSPNSSAQFAVKD